MIIDVNSDSQALRQFLALPSQIYRGDPNYCASTTASVLENLHREKFRGAQRNLIATDGDECIARVVARRSPNLKDDTGRPIGMLGFFEAADRPEAVREMFSNAVTWLRDAGTGMIVGPMDGDTWHRYRLNVGPFSQPPFLMEPYNPSYYPTLWESFGFEPLEGYYSKYVEDVAPAQAKLAPILKRVTSRGYRLRRIDMSRFSDELLILYQLSTELFADNFLYEEISSEEFIGLYEPVKALIDPDLVWFAQAPDESYVGFLFGTHDYHRAVTAMRGERGWLAKLRFVLQRRQANAVNLKSLGVVTAHRQSGLGAALMCRGYEMTLEKGYRSANLCLIRDGNPSGRLDGGEGSVSRRYVLYKLTD